MPRAGLAGVEGKDERGGFAVWDQQPARGYGGTADVVAHARERGQPVRIIWPDGATRD